MYKSFDGVCVLEDVQFDLYAGEIHALIGENGAGKSTLVKILGGIHRPDSGVIELDGVPVDIPNPKVAFENGISLIHQEISLFPELSVAENIYVGREMQTRGFINWKKAKSEAKAHMLTMGLDISPDIKVKDLSISQQQLVEITRSVSADAKIIVMDEPTSSLTDAEIEYLFEQIKMLKQKNVAIIYISHKMDEIFKICDRVTVLRDGKHIVTKTTSEIDYPTLIRHMVGRDIVNFYHKREGHESDESNDGDIVLEAKNISNKHLKNVSFSLKQGEVLGFAGLVGAGRTELARAIFGIDRIAEGSISLGGKELAVNSAEDAIRQGIALVPENRKLSGLYLDQSVSFNITITILNQIISRLSINRKKENNVISGFEEKLKIKMRNRSQIVRTLSGGNQQKVVIAKWLVTEPRILIMDEPTRGIDVGAKSEIYSLMKEITGSGVSIMMISSELPEIINMSDRIAIMCGGRLVKIVDQKKDEITQEIIMHYATGEYSYEKH